MDPDLANLEIATDLAVLDATPPNEGSFSAMTGIQMADNTLNHNNITPKMPMAGMELKA